MNWNACFSYAAKLLRWTLKIWTHQSVALKLEVSKILIVSSKNCTLYIINNFLSVYNASYTFQNGWINLDEVLNCNLSWLLKGFSRFVRTTNIPIHNQPFFLHEAWDLKGKKAIRYHGNQHNTIRLYFSTNENVGLWKINWMIENDRCKWKATPLNIILNGRE